MVVATPDTAMTGDNNAGEDIKTVMDGEEDGDGITVDADPSGARRLGESMIRYLVYCAFILTRIISSIVLIYIVIKRMMLNR